MKTNKLVLSAVLLSVVLTSVNTFAEAPAKRVKVDTAKEMNLDSSAELMATLHSKQHIPVTAAVSGRLEWVAEPGDRVLEGETLAKIETLPLDLKLAEQKAELKRAQIAMRYFKNEADRLVKLKDTNAASEFQIDEAQSKFELAQADREITELKIKQTQDQLERANIKARFDGIVTERLVRIGTDVSRSDTLLRFFDDKNLEAHVYVPVKYLKFLANDMVLSLKNQGQLLEAPITAIIPSADPRSQTFEVRITLPTDIDDTWAAGQLVRVVVPTESQGKSLTVARDALILRKDGTYVVKVNQENKAQRVKVNVGQGDLHRVSITGDISTGDKVAIRGAERLADGDTVTINL